MFECKLELELLEDAIFTASGKTVGRPESLDHPTGGSILGALSTWAYRDLKEQAFMAIQGGLLRISDARPLFGSEVGIPLPLSFHTVKQIDRHSPEAKGGLKVGSLLNLAVEERPFRTQLSQLRGAWLVRNGAGWSRKSVARNTSMRTAIDDDGMAREGLLYGFEAVPAGTRYVFSVRTVDVAIGEKVVEHLLKTPIRLGRSRSAEFGRAQVSECKANDGFNTGTADGPIRLLLLSDLALRDRTTGQPRLQPEASDFGLSEEWVLDLDKTFLRTRRYSPWNGHRQRPDLERQVLVAGSVLVFLEPAGGKKERLEADRQTLLLRLSNGVGECCGQGLGEVLCCPPLLAEKSPAIEVEGPKGVEIAGGPPTAKPPPGDLFAWLQADHGREKRIDDTWRIAEAFAEQLRKRGGVPRSQWGRVRAKAAGYTGRVDRASCQKLLSELRQVVGEGVSWSAWGKAGEDVFGKPDRKRTEQSGPRAPQASRQESSPDHTLSWSGGELEKWLAKSETEIDFPRAVLILSRRVVRGTAADPSSTGGGEL